MVISIIALLISILLPVLSNARRIALQSGCASNMRQVGIAASVYHTQHKGVLPHNEVEGSGVFASNPKNYADTPLKARGFWPDFLDYSDDPGSIGFNSTAVTSGGLYKGLGAGRRKVLESTILHCPQMLNNSDQRYHQRTGGGSMRVRPGRITPSTATSAASRRSAPTAIPSTTPPIPLDQHLASDRMWFMEGIGNAFFGDNTYVVQAYARLSQNTSAWNAGGFSPPPVWWRNSQSGLGHPSDAANVLYGDGHVASMVKDEMLGMSNSVFSQFAGYNWYKN